MKNNIFLSCVILLFLSAYPKAYGNIEKKTVDNLQVSSNEIQYARKEDHTKVRLYLNRRQVITLDFYADHIFRLYWDGSNTVLRTPQAEPPADILVPHPRKDVSPLEVEDTGDCIFIKTPALTMIWKKAEAVFSLLDKSGKEVMKQLSSVSFAKNSVGLQLQELPQEYFYGGGMQNGRFSHKGRTILIENTNSWTDGGVASPTPFYWSTNGYGIMWHTFAKGKYDFGMREPGVVSLSHETDYLDIFVMVSPTPKALLNDFYQLTGNPVLLPKFGFYQGHLNAYNRDYWKEDEQGILFEDGKRYKESQKDNGGIKESLNGEAGNYQFSARAVIDRYKQYDMPLGWVLPNDGYGAGYGQSRTLDGNIQNLKSFTDYARKHGVEVGLWTQSDLHPKPDVSPLLQRDIIKEVQVAGVRALKTDVAWVGAGYSFGLNGIADVANIMPKYGNNARPFIITLDGWAGTQRYAGLWSGDQTGGVWEYIRFHLPTYIGTGLSGNPNVGSDMDGIFGGNNPIVNIRDFQWKTFTPLQLNMDGWGANEKYPHALGEPATTINRWYLKLRSQLMPYIYTVAHQSISGKPMVRAMMLHEANRYTLGRSTQYQFLFGEDFLVAPIYQDTRSDEHGNDWRNHIYLPKGEWIDYFSGHKYEGGRILNNFDAPIWKLPLFVRNGAIIPMYNPNNQLKEVDLSTRIYEIYPAGKSEFTEYDDDGTTLAYQTGAFATTKIEVQAINGDNASIVISPTKGDFDGLIKNKQTELRINLTQKPQAIKVTTQHQQKKPRTISLRQVHSLQEFKERTNVYYYTSKNKLQTFTSSPSIFDSISVERGPMLYVKIAAVDITKTAISVHLDGFEYAPVNPLYRQSATLAPPTEIIFSDSVSTAYTLTPSWRSVPKADFYEIEFEDMLYTGIRDTALIFENLTPATSYSFKLRSVSSQGVSPWISGQGTTLNNPLEFAIHPILVHTSAPNQGNSLSNLCDLAEGELWHTKYGMDALPFDVVMDLQSVNQLDKFVYVPRDNAGNGTILEGEIFYSMDKKHWHTAGTYHWQRDNENKVFVFESQPSARYVKISVTKAVGGFGSGKEMYVFRVPHSDSYLPGDITGDGVIDNNDLVSYTNYTGLRQGDSDFEGYVSRGDLNNNGLIDAYDISVVATQLNGGVELSSSPDGVDGELRITPNKKSYRAGDEIILNVQAVNFSNVNAFSFALPYKESDYEFVSIHPSDIAQMQNLTNDRLHTNGSKSLYVTFVNIGNQPTLSGTCNLLTIRLKARKDSRFELSPTDGLLVDKQLEVKYIFRQTNTD